jgi:small GTP-binding protein
MADYVFKVILTGPAAVGKTSILQRFVHNTFSESYSLTIGVDFLSKTVELEDGESARLTIWDIGGQKRFEFMRSKFYNGANGALLVYDLTREETFEKVKESLEVLRREAGNDVDFILVGNKLDLIESVGRVISPEKAKNFAEDQGSFYIETSAKTGDSVEEAFVKLTQKMADNTSV